MVQHRFKLQREDLGNFTSDSFVTNYFTCVVFHLVTMKRTNVLLSPRSLSPFPASIRHLLDDIQGSFKTPCADNIITPDSSHHRRQLGRRYADRTVNNSLAHLQMKDVQVPVPPPPSPPPATTSGLSHPKRKEVMRYDVRENCR